MVSYLDFEKSLSEIEGKIRELNEIRLSSDNNISMDDISKLEKRSQDWLEEKYDYDGFVFLSKHAAESGVLALTCHSTGNFSEAKFGGNNRQVAIPHPDLQKRYLQTLQKHQSDFSEFQITIEATHHGPTGLTKPTIFIEIGTTPKQWTDVSLCESVAKLVHQVFSNEIPENPVAICFGGNERLAVVGAF